MIKTYKINGKEIQGFQGRWDGTAEGKINELLEALSDKEEKGYVGFDDAWDTPKQCIHGIYLVDNTICDKCLKTKKCVTCGENDHDYCTPKQSTSLKELIIQKLVYVGIRKKTYDDLIKEAEDIISFIQSHLIKEIGEYDTASWNAEDLKQDIIKIINNIIK